MNFPISESSPITYPGPPPMAADVVVIGGGIIGVCTALWLARAGQKVVLCEKGRIAGEQSSRNWGWIRQQGRDIDELPIMQDANRYWQQFDRETNSDLGLKQVGVSYLAYDDEKLAGFEAWVKEAAPHGVDSRMINSVEAAALNPDASRPFKGGMHTASDMKAEPFVATPILAELAARDGAILVENCAVRTLETTNGAVSGVVTESGRIQTSRVVVAGGAWSSLFLRAHGIEIPQLSVRSSVCATQPLPDIGVTASDEGDIAWRRRDDGGYTLAPGFFHEFLIGPDAFRSFWKYLPQLREEIKTARFLPGAPSGYPDSWGVQRKWGPHDVTPFERMRVLNPTPNMKKLNKIAKGFQELFPKIGPVRIERAWAGMIDTMPDIVPVVDEVAAMPGLIIGTGMCGHGFGIGPGMGKVLADLAMDLTPKHNLSRFRFARFTDGTELKIGTSL